MSGVGDTRDHRQRGSTIVEFSLLLPVLALLALAAMEFSNVYLIKRHLNEAARMGARTGSTRGTTTNDTWNAIETYLDGTAIENDFTTSITGVGPNVDADTNVVVSVSHDLELITGVQIPGLGSSSIPISASVTMRHQ